MGVYSKYLFLDLSGPFYNRERAKIFRSCVQRWIGSTARPNLSEGVHLIYGYRRNDIVNVSFLKQRLNRRWSQSSLFNIFHYKFGNDGGYWTIRWTEVSTAGYAGVPYILGVTESIKKFWASHNVKVAQNPLQTQGISSLNPCYGSWQRTDSYCSILYKDYEHVCIWQTKCEFATRLRTGATLQKAVFPCKNENSALSEHACKPTLQFGGVILKLLSLVYTYRIYSSKRRGAYLIFRATSAALIRGRRLFKRSTRQIYFFYIFILR